MHAWLITTQLSLYHKCSYIYYVRYFVPMSTINNMRRYESLKLYHKYFMKIMHTVIKKQFPFPSKDINT
jgi:hypothetical protein